jgi:hypothetical protein
MLVKHKEDLEKEVIRLDNIVYGSKGHVPSR